MKLGNGKMRSWLLGTLICACCLAAPIAAQSGRKPPPKPGQQPGAEQKPGDAPIVRIETREVVLPLVAYDAEGNYVDDLTAKDVLVLEDGEPRQVAHVKREPANIVLVLDLSNEIGTFKNGPTERFGKSDQPIWHNRDYQVLARPTAHEFADKFITRLSPQDSLAVIQYADKVQLIQDWTNEHEQALQALRSKYRVGIKSSYHDALKLAADKLQTRSSGRRVIVLVSDGLDSNSKTGRTAAFTALSKARATVFVIGWADALKTELESAINWTATHERQSNVTADRIKELRRHLLKLEGAAAELRNLAETSGGDLWLPPSHEDLIRTWRPLAQELGAQYSLSFITERKPSVDDNRAIQVLPARPGLSVRSRRSYYVGDETK
jgi:Ca-activated chloride channel homolog